MLCSEQLYSISNYLTKLSFMNLPFYSYSKRKTYLKPYKLINLCKTYLTLDSLNLTLEESDVIFNDIKTSFY